MSLNSSGCSVGFPEESALLRLFGDFSDPVPSLQMIGLAGKDLEICVEDFLDRHHVPYGVIDSAVFEECRGSSSCPLISWMWTCFEKQLVDSICRCFPKDGIRCSKLKHCELRTPMDLVRWLSTIIVSDVDFNPSGNVRCISIVVRDYQELLTQEPTLLNTLLRLHEKLGNVERVESVYRKKVVVILIGSYPIPPEAVRNNFVIPIVYMNVLSQQMRTLHVRSNNMPYALTIGKEILHHATNDVLLLLWDGFVNYLVDVVHQWYATDPLSLEFYCRLLWPSFLEPLRSCEPAALADVEGNLSHLCMGVDPQIRNIIRHYQSRFIGDLLDTGGDESAIIRKQLHKFHGSRLAKYLLLGAAISTFSRLSYIRDQFHKRSRRIARRETDIWRNRRRFDIRAWLANTEWVLIANESERLVMDHTLYAQILWIIEEGYVKPLANLTAWKRLPSSRGARLWRVSDVLPSSDLPWKDAHFYPSSTAFDVYISQILNNSARFVLCAPKEMIISAVKDLNLDLDEYIVA